MKNITLGRYVPYNSFIHRTDARLKLLSLIIIMSLLFFKFASTPMNFIMYGVIAIIVLILMRIAHIRLRSLFRSLRGLWFMVLFLLILNIFTYRATTDTVAFMIGTFTVYWGPIIQTAYIFLRIALMLSLTMVLTGTTMPLDLSYALEWYMLPLKVIRFPVHEVAMTISIALRFIPTLLDETGRIMKAQECRGVDYKKGKISEKLRSVVALIVPLFVSAFQRSDDLANAMEARGYNPQGKRTRYRILKWRWADTIFLCISLLLLGGFIALSVLKIDFVPVLTQLYNIIRGWF